MNASGDGQQCAWKTPRRAMPSGPAGKAPRHSFHLRGHCTILIHAEVCVPPSAHVIHVFVPCDHTPAWLSWVSCLVLDGGATWCSVQSRRMGRPPRFAGLRLPITVTTLFFPIHPCNPIHAPQNISFHPSFVNHVSRQWHRSVFSHTFVKSVSSKKKRSRGVFGDSATGDGGSK